MFPMRILSDPSGSVEILALGIELGDPLFMEFEGSKVVGILEQAELSVERLHQSFPDRNQPSEAMEST